MKHEQGWPECPECTTFYTPKGLQRCHSCESQAAFARTVHGRNAPKGEPASVTVHTLSDATSYPGQGGESSADVSIRNDHSAISGPTEWDEIVSVLEMADPEHTRRMAVIMFEKCARTTRVRLLRQWLLVADHGEREHVLMGMTLEDVEGWRDLIAFDLGLRAEAVEDSFDDEPFEGRAGEFRCRRCGEFVLAQEEKILHECDPDRRVPVAHRESELRSMLDGLTQIEARWLSDRFLVPPKQVADVRAAAEVAP